MDDERAMPALPEAAAWLYEHWCDGPRKEVHFQRLDHLFYNLGGGYTKGVALYTEQQVRALLATQAADAREDAFSAALIDLLYDGNAVLAAVSERDRKWAGPEAVAAVLDTLARTARERTARTPDDGESDGQRVALVGRGE
jgi:hypothetical protein